MKRDPQARSGQIITAAGAVFAAEGFAGARVDAIAETAGLNKRLLYHYVGDKTALFVAVLKREAQHLDDVFRLPDPQQRRRLWRLLIEENAHLDEPLLGRALIRYLQAASREGGAVEAGSAAAPEGTGPGTETADLASRLALDLLAALLPDLLGMVRGIQEDARAVDHQARVGRPLAGDQVEAGPRRKPRVRMEPTVLRPGDDS